MTAKNRQQFLIVATIALVALFAGDKLLFSPLVNLWKERSLAVAKLRQQVTEGTKLVRREQGLRRSWDQMRTNTLPADTSLAEQEVLKAFDFWSQDSHVSILSITPNWKRDSEDYITLQCRVDAAGNLATITRFLYDIEKDPLALKLETVELTARDNEGQQLALTLQISGLVLNPPAQ